MKDLHEMHMLCPCFPKYRDLREMQKILSCELDLFTDVDLLKVLGFTALGELTHKVQNLRTMHHTFNSSANQMEALLEVGQHAVRQLAHIRYPEFTRMPQGHKVAAEALDPDDGPPPHAEAATRWNQLRPDTLAILGEDYRSHIDRIDAAFTEERRREALADAAQSRRKPAPVATGMKRRVTLPVIDDGDDEDPESESEFATVTGPSAGPWPGSARHQKRPRRGE